jgi:hypothetical protein
VIDNPLENHASGLVKDTSIHNRRRADQVCNQTYEFREISRIAGREGGREGGMEGGREGGREGGKEG